MHMMKLIETRCAVFFIFLLTAFLMGCARMGNPDGGWFDDTPPRVVSASPNDKGVGVKSKKVTINFNEFIKIEDAQNKVIVSPPQIEQAEIKASGKRIVIELKDSLKENTTYTVDFSDAIVDNNEGNPMGNYTYSFSTGSQIDTLEVSGYVLNAENLEPVKGILVGLYDNLSDTIFRKEPMMRVSRTNGSGRFTIKGIAPGQYRVYALQDANSDFIFNQKSEAVGFSHDLIKPSWKPDTRQDTVWLDSLHISNILRVPYTHFLPDDITLLSFQEPQTDRYLLKTERKDPDRLGFFFSYGHEQLPLLKGLNFNADSAFVVEASQKQDTIVYWLRDTTLINQDTLQIEAQYYMTDTLGNLFLKTDTLDLTAKVSYEKRQKEFQREWEKWKKQQDRLKKRGERYDSIYPTKQTFELKVNTSAQMSPLGKVFIEVSVPIERLDTAGIHLYSQIDSVWYEAPFKFEQKQLRVYEITAEWKPDIEYSLEIDSMAFEDIYGLTSMPVKKGIKIQNEDEFSSLFLNLSGVSDTCSVVVQLLDGSDKVVRQENAQKLSAEFYYLRPGKYYVRAFVDYNRNGLWDTGKYDDDLQAEPVYYYKEEIECKQKWDVSRDWNLVAIPRYQQKPLAITKQKPDKEKQLKNRNAERAKKLGKEYIKDKGINI